MRSDTARNVAIILGISLAVFFMSGSAVGGQLLVVIRLVVQGLLIAAFLYIAYVLWKRYRYQLAYAPTRERSLIYAMGGLLFVLLLAAFFWPAWSLVSAVVYFGLIGGLSYGIWRLWNETRRYY